MSLVFCHWAIPTPHRRHHFCTFYWFVGSLWKMLLCDYMHWDRINFGFKLWIYCVRWSFFSCPPFLALLSIQMLIITQHLVPKQALESLNKKDMTEIKSYGRPPMLVEKVMEAVMILRGSEPTWPEAKKQLGESLAPEAAGVIRACRRCRGGACRRCGGGACRRCGGGACQWCTGW